MNTISVYWQNPFECMCGNVSVDGDCASWFILFCFVVDREDAFDMIMVHLDGNFNISALAWLIPAIAITERYLFDIDADRCLWRKNDERFIKWKSDCSVFIGLFPHYANIFLN